MSRAVIVKSSRIRFLHTWAEKLPTNDPEEIRHAVRVFAEARWKVSKPTARDYAKEVLNLMKEEE